MAWEKLPAWPNEGDVGWRQRDFDSSYRTHLGGNFQENEEHLYAKRIAESRDWVEVKITKENVVAGLKFIVEHQDMKQGELIDELIKLGCNFTFDDLKRQFPMEEALFPGMEEGSLRSGALVIINYMVGGRCKSYVEEHFLSVDNKTSAYAFIRKVTSDKSYTKERIDSEKKENIMDRRR